MIDRLSKHQAIGWDVEVLLSNKTLQQFIIDNPQKRHCLVTFRTLDLLSQIEFELARNGFRDTTVFDEILSVPMDIWIAWALLQQRRLDGKTVGKLLLPETTYMEWKGFICRQNKLTALVDGDAMNTERGLITNPARFRTRYHLYREFAKYIEDSGAILVTVEVAFGDREFEVTDSSNPNHIQFRTSHELWHKENLINLAAQRLPKDWKYVAWIDADVQFARKDWVDETIHQLQHFSVVQMFSHALDLGPDHQPLNTFVGFVAQWYRSNGSIPANMEEYGVWHPGYAWAMRRDAWDALGGLIDWAIIGSADRYMACSLIGELVQCLSENFATNCPIYTEWCFEWQARAERHIKHNIGYVDGLLMHYFHGSKRKRGYFDRPSVLWANYFDPSKDIKRDSQGLWQLTDQKPKLRDQLRMYFVRRDEDSRDL
ncbi:unnamed protein product [Sphagnum tenellum]